jgi:hypothetical protein
LIEQAGHENKRSFRGRTEIDVATEVAQVVVVEQEGISRVGCVVGAKDPVGPEKSVIMTLGGVEILTGSGSRTVDPAEVGITRVIVRIDQRSREVAMG